MSHLMGQRLNSKQNKNHRSQRMGEGQQFLSAFLIHKSLCQTNTVTALG